MKLFSDNCNAAVDYGKGPFGFRITGIGGSDILDGNKTLTLGLVWQVMRAYTLSILQKLAKSSTPIADKDIINWANDKVKSINRSLKEIDDDCLFVVEKCK